MKSTERIDAELIHLAALRGSDKTFCPSEVARSIGGQGWRDLMPKIRRRAAHLAAKGQLVCTQRGAAVDPLTARGPIRLGQPPTD